MKQEPLIVIVGVCASGKTTLSSGLRNLGYNSRSFAQEHSVSESLWERLEPDVLIYLNCSYRTIKERKDISWGLARYRQQLDLLNHARRSADLIIETDQFSPEQLVDYAHRQLQELGIQPKSN